MAKEPAFDDDMLMMIFGGKDDPMKPGMHGDTEVNGAPEGTADEVLIKIKDLITEYLDNKGAPEKPEKPQEDEGDQDNPQEGEE